MQFSNSRSLYTFLLWGMPYKRILTNSSRSQNLLSVQLQMFHPITMHFRIFINCIFYFSSVQLPISFFFLYGHHNSQRPSYFLFIYTQIALIIVPFRCIEIIYCNFTQWQCLHHSKVGCDGVSLALDFFNIKKRNFAY